MLALTSILFGMLGEILGSVFTKQVPASALFDIIRLISREADPLVASFSQKITQRMRIH